MVYLELDGHDFQYEVLDVLKLFFRDEKVIVVHNDDYGEDYDENTGIVIKNSIRKVTQPENEENYYFELMTSLRLNCKNFGPFTKEITGLMEKYNAKEGHEAAKQLRKVIKRQVYKALAEITGQEMPWGILTGIRPAKIVHEMLDRGINKEQILDKLRSYYFVSKNKAELLYDVSLAEKSVLDNSKADMVSIYIGIPFCPTRCLYCSFTSNPVKKYEKVVGDYMFALAKEINSVGRMLDERKLKVQSIYIGGGTPTAIDAQYLDGLLREIEANFSFHGVEEFTLEAGRPDSITEDKLKVIAASKVSRISINPQTMKNDTLVTIGRSHTSEDIVEAFRLARKLGFNNINMDVIAGLPGEKLNDFLYTLQELKKLSPESITVHTMSVKRASRLTAEKESHTLTDGAEVSKMVDCAYEFITGMGLRPYYLYRQKNILGNLENIGYCKPGAESVYNIQIMEERQTILALGAGATTKLVYPKENRIERVFNVKSVEEYISRVDEMIKRKENMRF